MTKEQKIIRAKIGLPELARQLGNGRAQLLTCTGLDWTEKYPSLIEALSNLNVKTAYLDGELCGVDEAGLPSFAQTQAATDGEREVRLVYVGQHRDLLASACLAGLPAHGGQLRPIAADIGHVMGDDQMVLGIDGDLRIVADNASALPLVAIERASGSVRDTCLSGAASTWLPISLRDCICRRRPPIFFLRRIVFASAVSPSSRSARSKTAR